MQRVTQESERTKHDFASLLHVIVILQRHFPPSISSVFAIPRQVGQSLQWWTALEGKPMPFRELDNSAQKQLLVVLDGRFTGIGNLAQRLVANGNIADAAVLQNLISQQPDHYEQLWNLNGEPLITAWGLHPVPASVASSPHGSSPLNVATIPVLTQPTRRNWWLLWLLLISLLLALLYYLWPGKSRQVNFPPKEIELPYACRKDADPPDFVIVLDTSASMSLNINISETDEKWMLSSNTQSMSSLRDPKRIKAALTEPKRISVAKEALLQVINGLHTDISINLITFGLCGETNHRGFFGPDDRMQLVKTIRSLSSESATPIAQSLLHAASLVDGKEKDAIVILFIDGGDGCNQDVCEVSRTIAQEKPNMRVNVVNISDRILSDCVAENTGGRVYAAKEAEQLKALLNSAANEVMSAPICPNQK